MRRFIEVCAGCGGLSSGFIQAGFKPILLNEIDKICCATLGRNHPDTPIRQCSIHELDVSAYEGQVDVLMGGIPCQPFSHAGLRKGLEDDRGTLIYEFHRLVRECRPTMFIVENVRGLLTIERGETFRHILSMFQEDGEYRVYHSVLNAKDYRVAQKRERLFLVGVHTSISKEFVFPSPIGDDVLLKHVLTDVPPSIGLSYPAHKREVLDLVPQGGCWVNLPTDVQTSYVGEHVLSLGGGKRGIARRLSMDEHCLTLTTSPCQKQTERCHPTETRPFTVREYARIQSFPDSYEFCGSIHQQYRQIGNAVPVNLAYHLALTIQQYLNEASRE